MTTDWRSYAACREVDPELWYADSDNAGNSKILQRQKKARIEQAVTICRGCFVQTECLADEQDTGDGVYGIRAGLTADERNPHRYCALCGRINNDKRNTYCSRACSNTARARAKRESQARTRGVRRAGAA